MKLADRELVYDERIKLYVGRRQFLSVDGTLKFSSTWYAEYSLAGKQRCQALGVRTLLHARKAGIKLAESLASGDVRTTDHSKLKLGEVITRYLAYQEQNDRAPKTMEKYGYVLRTQLEAWWTRRGNKPAATFTAEDFHAFRQKLTDDKLQAKTISDRLMVVRQVFKWASMRCDPPLVPRYVLASVKPMKVPDKDQPCFTAEQVQTILQHASADERPIYATFAYTGMRFGEARDLEWTDVQLTESGGTIRISRGGSRKGMTKNGKSRTIPITAELHAVLSALPRSGNRVFSHPPTSMYPAGTRPLEETQLLKRFKRLCQRAGFEDWKKMKLHTFRHFFASICARNNVSYKFALRWMGHRDSQILDLYFHMYDREAQEAINGLDFGLGEKKSITPESGAA